jgi:high frequency lysogenization protein
LNDSSDPVYRQVLALAGVFQTADLVVRIAWHGSVESDSSASLLNSIFKIDADTIEEIYGSVDALHDGLAVLSGQLGDGVVARDTEVARYTAQLLALQSKLANNAQAMHNILHGIREAQQQLPMFGIHHANIIARLADIYSSNVSPIRPRIMVNGEPLHLNDSSTASLIRALLLAGIRSAVLWRQSGGSRIKLFFHRGRYLRCTQSIVRNID